MSSRRKSILVTGGAGYIGSHTVLRLLEANHDVVVVDNLSNSSSISLNRVSAIVGVAPDFAYIDLRDSLKLDSLFREYHFDAVIHFAGLKAVAESVSLPLRGNSGDSILNS